MAAVTAPLVCAAALVLLCLVPGTPGVRLAEALSPPRPPVRRWTRVRARALASRAGERAARRRAVVVLCRVLAAELRAGQPPREALRVSAAEVGPLVGPVSDAESLRRAAERGPGLEALAYLAVCWEVAADTGAGLAGVVDALSRQLTEQEEQRAEAAARTSGPRTTAVVLMSLPLAGLVAASALGGSPLAFLFTTPPGLACLVLGVALDAFGAWWTLRMLRSATADPPVG
ncbi:type II secretion system F family protein [Nocardiopsis sp. FR4]|uniref:type II secretion system F family protein n=1 Tax=Nocardiopsis sp. FR4 TaxID=2605985 RepID=UPI0019167A35|nr:type II secretion system F family protein [Nocardiopsis sp. FR4]